MQVGSKHVLLFLVQVEREGASKIQFRHARYKIIAPAKANMLQCLLRHPFSDHFRRRAILCSSLSFFGRFIQG